jgi:hypothetical protein
MVIVLTTVVVRRVEMLEELFGVAWCTKLEFSFCDPHPLQNDKLSL